MAARANSKNETKWRFETPTCRRYFTQKHIDNVAIRRALNNRTEEEINRRNNVEATMFLLGHSLINGKSRYRKMLPNRAWAYTRGLAINITRICKYIETTCQRTQAMACLSDIYSHFCHLRDYFFLPKTKNKIFSPIYVYNQNKLI